MSIEATYSWFFGTAGLLLGGCSGCVIGFQCGSIKEQDKWERACVARGAGTFTVQGKFEWKPPSPQPESGR